ncbi:unnamed protein product [Lactuca saligna]|uniref:Uncharacterized protein n=1 Tax=Lactuca saligna TaxID=75948 RepID=A0AA35YMY6_LACSI|nr:unnamed protein product [Lactuca saligna]
MVKGRKVGLKMNLNPPFFPINTKLKKIYEESTGPPPTDEISIEEESSWILHQLQTGVVLFGKGGNRTIEEGHDLATVKDDIMRFLEFMHVQKLDVPFISMYRKEECMSLFKDLEPQDDKESENKSKKKPTLRWHYVLWAIRIHSCVNLVSSCTSL